LDSDEEIQAAVRQNYADAIARGDDEQATRWRTFGEHEGVAFD